MNIEDVSMGTLDVLKERLRQIEAEGYGAAHDDTHTPGELALAALCYTYEAAVRLVGPDVISASARSLSQTYWPWHIRYFKPKTSRQDLVRAAALLLAEIDKIDRAEAIPL